MNVLAYKGTSKEVTNSLFIKVSLGCWRIWCARNDVCFIARVVDSYYVVHHFYRSLKDLLDCAIHHHSLSSKSSPSKQKMNWTPPPPGVIKVNTDAACPKSERKVLLAAITHDDAGVMIGSVIVQMDVILVLTAEINAIMWGLKLAN